MGYRLKKEETVEAAVRRIAREQLEKAVSELKNREMKRPEVIHRVRKRCKKIRGLIRLVRPCMGAAYPLENARFRDMAKELAFLRDVDATVEAAHAMRDAADSDEQRDVLASVTETLHQRKESLAGDERNIEDSLDSFYESVREAVGAVARWEVGEDGFSALEGGLKKTYGRARKGMLAAYRDGSPEAFHEWRKRAKYHWYHMRLLRNTWKPVLQPRAEQLHVLSNLLGDDHDLTVLDRLMREQCTTFVPGADARRALDELLRHRKSALRSDAWFLGRVLFAEKPKAFRRRIHAYWDAWQERSMPAA